MSEKPILFSGPMVRAILAGRKTQTRRVITPQPQFSEATVAELTANRPGLTLSQIVDAAWQDGFVNVRCPYDADLLWVRETWAATHGSLSHEYGEHSVFDWDEEHRGPLSKDAAGLELYFRADGEDALPAEFSMPDGSEIRWRPSIHMPRWASRITLPVESVRVERLQDISEADAKAEGIEEQAIHPGAPPSGFFYTDKAQGWGVPTAGAAFMHLWNKINGKRAPWSSNPWVWVVTFGKAEVRQ